MKRYLTSAFLCLFGISAVLYACKSGDVVPSLPSDHYVLTRGTLFPTSAGVNVVADTVSISICPPNSACFIADNASVSVRLIQNSETRSVRLFAWINDGVTRRPTPTDYDSTSVRFDNQLYKVILKARYIDTNGKNKGGQAILQVSKL